MGLSYMYILDFIMLETLTHQLSYILLPKVYRHNIKGGVDRYPTNKWGEKPTAKLQAFDRIMDAWMTIGVMVLSNLRQV